MDRTGVTHLLSYDVEELQQGFERTVKILAVTSGKGGVGKSCVVANLACSLSSLGKRVMVLDANLGLGNLDIILGLTPQYSMDDVIAGRKKIHEVVMDGPTGIRILPASYGIHEVVELTRGHKVDLLSQLEELQEDIDFLLIDTAAGISSDVMFFNVAAHEIVVVVSPDPTSITDAYSLMKVLSQRYGGHDFLLLVNSVSSEDEAKAVYKNLCAVVDQFLNVYVSYLGFILYDPALVQAVRLRKAVVEVFPGSQASRCFRKLARDISASRELFS